MRYVTVRVVDSGGKPVYYARVTLGASYGILSDEYTDHDGIASFEVDYDEINVYVNGDEKVRMGSIRGNYVVTV